MSNESISSAVVRITSSSPVTPSVATDGQVSPQDSLLTHFFGVPNPTTKQAEYLAEIESFLQDKTDGTEEDKTRVLRDIKYRLGAPTIASDSLENVYRYIHLRQQAKIFDQRAKNMEQ